LHTFGGNTALVESLTRHGVRFLVVGDADLSNDPAIYTRVRIGGDPHSCSSCVNPCLSEAGGEG